MKDLVNTIKLFIGKLYSNELALRIRPSYFPFTEPGFEVDVSCIVCEMKGCHICKHSGFLEIAGCGMVHPNVLREGGLDPKVHSGFAFGIGIDRLLLLERGIPDIRYFYDGDARFINQGL